MSDKMLDLIWSLDIEKLNDHLPTERKSLKVLLSEEKPQVQTKNKKFHRFKKQHLEIICQFFPEKEWSEVKLPVILLRRTSLGKGIYSVSGGLRELYIIHRISGRITDEFSKFKFEEHQPYVWKPEVFSAVRKIGSIVVVGYT
ncbi:MAG: DUF61 family protein [Candidatus Heimdallarchaeota archaeon]|nr:DUF61 family protein [Candidatus Heimdallarchaeota archaeon]MBY8995926.1 DUF61 family protein [Candidatus Heimdallarchaeota archaeon]